MQPKKKPAAAKKRQRSSGSEGSDGDIDLAEVKERVIEVMERCADDADFTFKHVRTDALWEHGLQRVTLSVLPVGVVVVLLLLLLLLLLLCS